jgi:hypothetical protein
MKYRLTRIHEVTLITRTYEATLTHGQNQCQLKSQISHDAERYFVREAISYMDECHAQ